MMEFLMELLNGAENVVIILGVCVGLKLWDKAIDHAIENTENEKVRTWLEEIDKTFEKAVKAVNQTLVDGLKYEGAFDEEAQKKARGEAKELFLRSLSDEARVWLRNAYTFSDSFIRTGIEAAVANAKNEKKDELVIGEVAQEDNTI